MTTKELLVKYPNGKFTNFPGDKEYRYKVLSPLFEDLYENKMIYYENGKYLLIRVDNLEITSNGISATAFPIKFLFTAGNELKNLEQWTFRLSWDWMILGDWLSFHTPYLNVTIYLDKELIIRIEKLIEENRFDEMYKVICRESAEYFERQQKEELQKKIEEILVLSDFAKCWNHFNPYHIKKHLDKNVVYNSKWIDNQINGEDFVWRYLQKKLNEFKEKVGEGAIKAEIGYLTYKQFIKDKIFGNSKPCLIIKQRTPNNDIITIVEIEINEGKIVKINVGDVPKIDNRYKLIENPFGC